MDRYGRLESAQTGTIQLGRVSFTNPAYSPPNEDVASRSLQMAHSPVQAVVPSWLPLRIVSVRVHREPVFEGHSVRDSGLSCLPMISLIRLLRPIFF